MRGARAGLVAMILLVGCEQGGSFVVPGSPVDLGAMPLPLEDQDPTAGRFEATVTAEAALWPIGDGLAEMLTYDGLVPGPLIDVDLGDEVQVTLQNRLPDDFPTTIHWHGIEGFNASDGTPVTQRHVHPGDDFVYSFVATRPGLYWYHPHHRGAQGLFSGLYAPLIVRDPVEAELVSRGVLPRHERVWVLSDTSVYQGRVLSAEVDDAMTMMNGTEGEHLLVNGQEDPVFEVPAGEGLRLRIVNTSITRFWRLSVPGRTLFRVGGEGGLLDRVRIEGGSLPGEAFDPVTQQVLGPAEIDLGYPEGQIVLAPADRVDLVLTTDGEPGDELEVFWEDFARGRHTMWMEGDEMVMGDAPDDGTRPGVRIARIRLVEGTGDTFTIAEGDAVLTAVGQSVGGPGTPTLEWLGEDGTQLQEQMDMFQDDQGVWQMTSWLGMDGESWHPMGEGPEQPEAPSAHRATLGESIRWEIHNESRMAHPYHLHGFSYRPLELIQWPSDEEHRAAGAPAIRARLPYDELEDTTLLPGFSSLVMQVDLADPSGDGGALGRWVQHCHILQHGESGMMSELVVTEP